jgi:hypothetical protein
MSQVQPLDDDQSDIPDIDDGGIDILAEVELRRLTATPSSIVPFQSSLIAWDVRGPQGFSLRLNAAAVARIWWVRAGLDLGSRVGSDRRGERG